jgi:hypothetical protein
MRDMLDELGISYTNFNLDEDDYVDVFGWENHPFDRKMTHLHDTFDSDIYYERWQECLTIAMEYLNDR